MKVTDLTHPIAAGMPVYPGTEPPIIEVSNTVAVHGFLEHRLTMYSHTGTHMDAPAHMLDGGATLDSYPAEHFVGRAVCIDVRTLGSASIELGAVQPYEAQLRQAGFALLHTGWSQYWGSPAYFDGFPALTAEAARWLLQFNLKGVGVDAISVDPVGSEAFTVHKILLGQGLVLIENLTNLAALAGPSFLLSALPLNTAGADGAPVRAIGIEGI